MTPIESERWPRVRAIFELALEDGDFEAVLRRECGSDRELRDAVLALRASDAAAEALEPPPLYERPTRGPCSVGPGDRVGAFVIQREIERGGMGVVFEAEQLEPRRMVALKVLPAHGKGTALSERVENEAEILARLQHPGIAAVYAAGVHPLADGGELPYLAMELVADARDLRTFSDEKQLTPEQRLRLFREVCDAVHAAHQKGVIHHDLKPSNILVDGGGRVRVIDFGISQVAGLQKADAQKGSGRAKGVRGTPAYLSPERLVPGEDDQDLRSDVYSLGVVLSHLFDEAPPRALGWIIERARARVPADRYSSVAELAADVARFSAHEPVLAGPRTRTYRARCFVRRYRAGVAATIALVALLAGGLVGTTLAWREGERQKIAARAEARRSGALRDVLQSLIFEASPQRHGPNVKLLDGLDRVAEEIESAFVGQYDLQVAVMTSVAHVQIDIGQWRRARDLLERAVAIAENELHGSAELATALNLLGLAHQYLLATEQAGAAYRRADSIATELGSEIEDLQRAIRQNLAGVGSDASEMPRIALGLEEGYQSNVEDFGPDDERTLISGNNLAAHYRKMGRLSDALVLSERLREIWNVQGLNCVPALTQLHNHAHLLQQCDRNAEALAIEVQVLKKWPGLLGDDHHHVAVALQSAGIYALGAGEYAQAEGFFARLLDHPTMDEATPRQRVLRPLLHATAAVACGTKHYFEANAVFTAHLDAAAQHEAEARVIVWLARAAAARSAPDIDRDAVAARRAYDELCRDPGGLHWSARLAGRWLAER